MTEILGVVISLESYERLTADRAVDRELSTVEASETFGRSRKYWAVACGKDEVPGAYRDGQTWRLPSSGCAEHLEQKRNKALGKRRQRGPWDKGLPSRQFTVLEGGLEEVWTWEDGTQESTRPRLARTGTEDGVKGGR